jgi:hypothetical protein|tara:strand:- start:699 stop:854 length:156 start_codon:yes stop_codon:yes gene_type:complete
MKKTNKFIEAFSPTILETKVPAINQNGYGGYRAKNEKSKFFRENTTGWILV